MANIELVGFDAYLRKLRAVGGSTEKLCKATVYPGAEILANAMRESVNALPTISDAQARANYRSGTVNRALSVSQKAGLVESLGISPIKKDRSGMVQASVGFTGYNGVVTRHFPKGQPNPEVARSLEKGTSYLKRDRFVENTVKRVKEEILAAMAAETDAQIKKIMDQN